MGDIRDPEWLMFEEFKRFFRKRLRSEEASFEKILPELINEFMMPLDAIRQLTEIMRDQIPVDASTDTSPECEILHTGREILDRILHEVTRQQEMFNYVRVEVWRDEPAANSDSAES